MDMNLEAEISRSAGAPGENIRGMTFSADSVEVSLRTLPSSSFYRRERWERPQRPGRTVESSLKQMSQMQPLRQGIGLPKSLGSPIARVVTLPAQFQDS